MAENTSVVLAERPTGSIIPGRTFRIEKGPIPTEADLKDGQVLVETLYLSLDPAMRGWLNDKRSYLPPVQIGEVMRSAGVCRVVAARGVPSVQPGDIVTAFPGWTEYAIVDTTYLSNPLAEVPAAERSKLHPTDLVGVLGMTGLTAYFGVKHVAEGFRPTDTVVVSGAAGATGSVVGQLAKLQGAKKVIGIAGSADKCRWLVDELGFDVALNYKDADFAAQLRAATPDFIDVYWDNVGGDVLDAALARAATRARFVMCGAISQYNTDKPQGPANLSQVVTQRIKMQGFIVIDHIKEYPAAIRELTQWVLQGKIHRKDTIIKGGLPAAEQALVGLFTGANTGKLLVEVKRPDTSANL